MKLWLIEFTLNVTFNSISAITPFIDLYDHLKILAGVILHIVSILFCDVCCCSDISSKVDKVSCSIVDFHFFNSYVSKFVFKIKGCMQQLTGR